MDEEGRGGGLQLVLFENTHKIQKIIYILIKKHENLLRYILLKK